MRLCWRKLTVNQAGALPETSPHTIIFVVGGEIERMLAFKHVEHVRFPEPEAMPLL
jgi:hypothetical protein